MNPACTVIVRIARIEVDSETLLREMRAMLPTLERQEGFLGAETLVRDGNREVIHIVRWRDRGCYDRCQASPELMVAGLRLLEMLQAGALNMTVEVYAPADAPA
ncbi:MAG: antibiotic biosynthesis monooxygenase [Planctomycetes bacterium]|nr:antibiotic biosynthesis monooxygenase [Planctomycetota bacterium]